MALMEHLEECDNLFNKWLNSLNEAVPGLNSVLHFVFRSTDKSFLCEVGIFGKLFRFN